GQPRAGRPGGDHGCRPRGHGVAVPQHPLRGDDPARSRGGDVPARSADGRRRQGGVMTEPALLVLEDGRTFRGYGFGARGETFGEAVFATGMTGYQETLTDPSYHRQVVIQTAPHIGNTGMNDEDP